MQKRPKSVMVIGVGNVDRGDDGVGMLVTRLVRERLRGRVRALELAGEPLGMLDAWCGAEHVFIVDAIQSGDGHPGQVYRWDAHGASVPARESRHSSHALSVAQGIELARSLGTLPPCVVVYGVQGKNFAPGQALSRAAAAGAREAADRIAGEIRGLKSVFVSHES